MGRRTIDATNEIRAAQGLPLIKRKTKRPKVRKSNAILPVSKKARSQELLVSMLSSKGKRVVERVLRKALDDDDGDQLACLKIVMDRVLPSDYINKMKGNGNQIQIHISGVDETNINEVEAIDMEMKDGV